MLAQSKPENKQSEVLRILLIEDNPGDARLIKEMLSEVKSTTFHLECVDRLSSGLELLSKEKIDVVLLDLSLPDSHGLETFEKVYTQVPEVPIVVLTGMNDEILGMNAVQKGAQDYLIKGQVDSNLLSRSIRYSIERQRMIAELRSLYLMDDLTGLCNRRGFFTLSLQQLKMANRLKGEVFILFVDLDNMKWINDTFGHQEGDSALVEVANILRKTFRESDIIARIGGDEFAILAVEASQNSAEVLVDRLQENVEAHNVKGERPYKLSISIGLARFDPTAPCSLEELLGRADKLMYKHKRTKQGNKPGLS